MAADMSITNAPLTLIVAATTKNGIGKGGGLPWPMLKKEMAYFARVTKRLPPKHDSSHRNVVIMGRKTWDSIPVKLRPLKNRTNVVISSQGRESLEGLRDDVIVASDIPDGLATLKQLARTGKAQPVGRVFVIGGTSIYKKALELPQAAHILLTRIHKDYECDTAFPVDLQDSAHSEDNWQRQSHEDLQYFVDEEVPEGLISETGGGEEVEFEYQLYSRS